MPGDVATVISQESRLESHQGRVERVDAQAAIDYGNRFAVPAIRQQELGVVVWTKAVAGREVHATNEQLFCLARIRRDRRAFDDGLARFRVQNECAIERGALQVRPSPRDPAVRGSGNHWNIFTATANPK